jgi:hypothetical protein
MFWMPRVKLFALMKHKDNLHLVQSSGMVHKGYAILTPTSLEAMKPRNYMNIVE